jgi:hypothetical protein
MINLDLNEDFSNQNSSVSSDSIPTDKFLPHKPVPIYTDLKKKFRLQCRNFFLTYPQCHVPRYDMRQHINSTLKDAEYIHVAREFHEDGEPHLHVLVMCQKKKDITNQAFFDFTYDGLFFHPNMQAARDVDDVLTYISKHDNDPEIYGIFTSAKVKKQRGESDALLVRAQKNLLLLETPLPVAVDKGIISLYNYKSIRDNIQAYKIDSTVVDKYCPKENLWIVGDSGIGKSRWVRERYPEKNEFFSKAQNKWWDGYDCQQIVLIDDFDMAGKCLGHHLKIWGDCYGFSAEIKGGTIVPNVKKIIITSQYTPREIWCSGDIKDWDDKIVEAIERRFPIVTVKDGVIVPL